MRITRSKGMLVVALVSALALMFGQSAFGAHNGVAGVGKTNHELPPLNQGTGTNVLATCTAAGAATLATGVNLTATHGHYTFTSTTLTCTDNPLDAESWGGDYTVSADGGTDGPDHVASSTTPTTEPNNGGDDHGEDCAVGWSNSDGYSGAGANKGDIGITHKHTTGDHVSSSGTPNWVKFNRTATLVDAWGEFDFDPPAPFPPAHGGTTTTATVTKFNAQLVFLPTTGDCETTPGVTVASLTGTAVLFR